MKLTKIINDRTGHIILKYENEELLSLLWSAYSYSDNHNAKPDYLDHVSHMTGEERAQAVNRWWGKDWESGTIELMGHGEHVIKAITKRGWENPAGYISLEDVLDLLIELRSM